MYYKGFRKFFLTYVSLDFQKYGMTIDEAVEKLTSVRPHIVLREVHLCVLKEYRDTVYPDELTPAPVSETTAESTL